MRQSRDGRPRNTGSRLRPCISEDGAKTFLEAMRDIEAAKSRILVVSLPQQVLAVCKTVPGVRSQLPIADTIEDAAGVQVALVNGERDHRAVETGPERVPARAVPACNVAHRNAADDAKRARGDQFSIVNGERTGVAGEDLTTE